MKDKLILFGAGFYGRRAYASLHEGHDILYYVDNNRKIQKTKIYDVPVIGAGELPKVLDSERMDIVICARDYYEIENQLADMGITDYYVTMEGFLYHTDYMEPMVPIELYQGEYYRKEREGKSILFVQNAACIRTCKIAKLMKEKGYDVNLLCTMAQPMERNEQGIFSHNYRLTSMNGIVDFIQNSEFDVIHCSNEPDILANVALMANKPVVHDTHDMMSLRGDGSVNEMTLEYLANTGCHGNMYTSKAVAELAIQKFGLGNKPVISLENYVYKPSDRKKTHEKLSDKDGKIHLVYEGGLDGRNRDGSRFLEGIWDRVISSGVHIHYYSQSDPEYCKMLDARNESYHYEGNLSSEELVSEMTKYDAGLVLFHVTDRNRVFMETGTANKLYEYLNAGLPVIVGGIQSYDDFVNQYKVGISLDLTGDIEKQIRKAVGIHIPENFLADNNMTMMSRADELAEFYDSVARRHSLLMKKKREGAA